MTKPSLSATTNHLAPLLRAGLIAGMVVAVVAFPMVAVAGLVTKAFADSIEVRPADLLAVAPAQTTYVYGSDGQTLLTTFYEEHRKYVPISQMSPFRCCFCRGHATALLTTRSSNRPVARFARGRPWSSSTRGRASSSSRRRMTSRISRARCWSISSGTATLSP